MNGRRLNPALRNGGIIVEYVTWSDLVQILIAFSTTGAFLVALVALMYNVINNKKK